jgi:hypothetical protein
VYGLFAARRFLDCRTKKTRSCAFQVVKNTTSQNQANGRARFLVVILPSSGLTVAARGIRVFTAERNEKNAPSGD